MGINLINSPMSHPSLITYTLLQISLLTYNTRIQVQIFITECEFYTYLIYLILWIFKNIFFTSNKKNWRRKKSTFHNLKYKFRWESKNINLYNVKYNICSLNLDFKHNIIISILCVMRKNYNIWLKQELHSKIYIYYHIVL